MALSLGAVLTIVLAAALGVFCLVLGVWQARPNDPPANSTERLRRSIVVGFTFTGGFTAMVLIMGAVDPQYQWSWRSALGVCCVTAPLQLMVTIGAYVRLG